MARVGIAQPARVDIARIRNAVLTTNGQAVADRILGGLGRTIERLGSFPESGRRHPKLSTQSIRVVPFQRWLVVYQVADDLVTVLRVVDGARDGAGLDVDPM